MSTNKYGMTFNGIRKDYIVTLRGKRRPPWAPLETNLIYIPEMPGAYVEGTTVKPRPLSIPVLIESESLAHLKLLTEEVADWLITDEPKELIFDDEPNRVYYAKLDGSADIEEIIRVGAGLLEFICPDPYKYRTTANNSYVTNPVAPLVLANQGSIDVKPLFEVMLKSQTTYLDIIGSKEYMRIGRVPDVNETTLNPKQRIFWDDMSDISKWIKADSSDIDGGTIAGNMISNGFTFRQLDYGSGSSWHGDARIRSVGRTLRNFEVEYKIRLDNPEVNRIGRIELYLLDSAKRCLGKVALKDTKAGRDGNYAEFRVGNKVDGRYILTGHGSNIYTWLNFDGVLKLKRVGNKWTAYIAKIGANGEHTARKTVNFEDISNRYTGDVAYVVIHMAASGTFTPPPMFINDLKVFEINENTGSKVEVIGDVDDIFTFDHKKEIILKNGEPFMKKDMGSKFFPLYKGDNVLVVEPSSVISSVKTVWREGFK